MSNSLHSDVKAMLRDLRGKRGFNAQRYVDAKVRLLNDYMSKSNLSAIVLGVSGGVDSAAVIALVAKAAKEPNSPIKRIVAALLPYHIDAGTTNQIEATARGREVAEAFGADCMLVDLSQSHAAMKQVADAAVAKCFEKPVGGPWASGQLVSYLRTPALFYLSSLMGEQGFPAIVVGTTNRDEGGYIGYFGKAADAMVDLQLISDLHKSEVYAVSRLLNVPQCALEAEPTGDIYDGRNDEQLIGAPYDFIELYQLFLCLDDGDKMMKYVEGLSPEARKQFRHFATRLRQLNRENSHKYIGATTAVHLDVCERAVPGGWRVEVEPEHIRANIDRSVFVNEFQLDAELVGRLADADMPADAEPLGRLAQDARTDSSVWTSAPNVVARSGGERARAVSTGSVTRQSLRGFADSALVLNGVLSGDECAAIRADLSRQPWKPVGQNGMLKGFDPAKDLIGSYRATTYNEKFAEVLWQRIAPQIPSLRVMTEFTPTDTDGDPVWRAVSVNPLMRFIRYTQNGLLVPHYDAPYDYHDGKRTMMSLVLYLTDSAPEDGGATRFILDSQRHLPLVERDHSDWTRTAQSHEVLFSVQPKAGSTLIFDHRILHDSDVIKSSAEKIIMRTDIVFERCGLPRRARVTASRPLGMPETNVSTVVESDRLDGASDSAREELLERALADPFYGSAYQHLQSLDKIVEAGFFNDHATASDVAARPGPEWISTPVDKLLPRLAAAEAVPAKEDQFLAVLLCTGSYNPVHQGHVEMLEIARKEVEARGGIVLGGYMSASHDEYVSVKCGAEALPAPHRVRLVHESVASSDWIMSDGWEALAAERALNFTDVIGHLQRYLSRHVHTARPVHVVYVFGGDNAKFARTFIGRGRAVCVPRPGYETLSEQVANEPGIRGNDRIIFAKQSGRNAASSVVRKGSDDLMMDGARTLFKRWSCLVKAPDPIVHNRFYFLRNEAQWALEPWYAGRNPTDLNRAWTAFYDGLRSAIRSVHRSASGPDLKADVDFRELEIAGQRREAALLTAGNRIISLDPCIPGDVNLEVSRLFGVATVGGMPLIGARPGSMPLETQLAAIPPGKYVLFDDDIASGKTMSEVQSKMPEHVHIEHGCALTHRNGKDRDNLLDIIDGRDFLAGARDAGLAVILPNGTTARAPYALPYVWSATRASIPLSGEREFSRQCWLLNEAFFRSVSQPITVAETNTAFQKLASYIGFSKETQMADVCAWHVQRFAEMVMPSGA